MVSKVNSVTVSLHTVLYTLLDKKMLYYAKYFWNIYIVKVVVLTLGKAYLTQSSSSSYSEEVRQH